MEMDLGDGKIAWLDAGRGIDNAEILIIEHDDIVLVIHVSSFPGRLPDSQPRADL
jgi:hypothetical protein